METRKKIFGAECLFTALIAVYEVVTVLALFTDLFSGITIKQNILFSQSLIFVPTVLYLFIMRKHVKDIIWFRRFHPLTLLLIPPLVLFMEPLITLLNAINSVIIRKSDKSTSQSTYINIYNDKNRNGELDEGESAFELDGSADILYPGMPVYGLYEQKSDRPLAITLDGVELGSVYGVYGGCIETESDSAALIVRALNEADLKILTAAEKSEVKGDVELQFVDTSVSSGPLYIGKTAQISGNVSLSLNGGSYYMINALASGSTVQKNVDVKLRNVSFTGTDTSGIVLSGSTVNGDVNFDADGINVSSQSEFHVLNSGSANNLTVSLKN